MSELHDNAETQGIKPCKMNASAALLLFWVMVEMQAFNQKLGPELDMNAMTASFQQYEMCQHPTLVTCRLLQEVVNIRLRLS